MLIIYVTIHAAILAEDDKIISQLALHRMAESLNYVEDMPTHRV